jgi:hypothetical protein
MVVRSMDTSNSGRKRLFSIQYDFFNGKFSSLEYSMNSGFGSLYYDVTDIGLSVGIQGATSKLKLGVSLHSGFSLGSEGTNKGGVISGAKAAFRPGGYSLIILTAWYFAPEIVPVLAF